MPDWRSLYLTPVNSVELLRLLINFNYLKYFMYLETYLCLHQKECTYQFSTTLLIKTKLQSHLICFKCIDVAHDFISEIIFIMTN